MEIVTLEITPKSAFATPPKGDTIFGQILAYLFLQGDTTFATYLQEEPKLIVSDMMPKGYVYRPNLPMDCFKQSKDIDIDKKKIRAAKYIKLENLQRGELYKCEKVDFMQTAVVVKNSINRQTGMTDGEDFAPYSMSEYTFGKKLWLFMMVEPDLKEKILDVLSQIGTYGFGKEASIGKGLFTLRPIDTPINMNIESNYYMCISPVVVYNQNCEAIWYEPYTKFGKYGSHNGSKNIFKKPLLMAQSGAVIRSFAQRNYFGSALDIGYQDNPSFNQGYSITLPFTIKDERCLSAK